MLNSSQRMARHVIINDSNINTNILMKHHILVHNTSLWHKLYVSNCDNMEKKILLKMIMDELHPHDFIPVNYVYEDNGGVSFLIKNCAGAIKQICAQNLIVRNSIMPERPLKFLIILGFASTQEIKVNMEDKISTVIKRRFNTETKLLNLDSFYKDNDLEEFCPLSQPKILLFVLHMCKHYPFLTLRLSNNEIRSLDALDALISLKVSFGLDLRNNLITKEDDLTVLSSILISEIVLDGNPICENMNETAYVKVVKGFCPDVKKIDGISVWNGFLPHRRNYLCNPEAKDLIDHFLEHYFTLYDTTNYRNYLENLYHPNSIFTLTCHYISGQQSSLNTRLMSYKKYSRNIKFMSNLSKCDEFVFKGPKKIIEILSDLPLSEHDPYSFTVDLIYYTEICAIFVLTGVFREPAQNLADAERYLGFVRTFTLYAETGGRYVITNEELHVNNATSLQQNSSFKYTRVPGNVSILSRLAPNDEKERLELIKAMSCISTLNPRWAKKCLEDTSYNLKNALTLFVDLFKTDQIPEEGFRCDEDVKSSTQPTLISDKMQPSTSLIDNNSTTISDNNDTRSNPDSKMELEIEPGEIIDDKDVKPVINTLQNRAIDEKNDYYSTQMKKISSAKQNLNMHKAKEIATETMLRYREDSMGYKQLIQLHSETKDLVSARYILQKAKMNLVRRKYVSVLKSYFYLELLHGSPEYLLTVIEKEKYSLKILDYAVDYIKASLLCKQEENAKEFMKSHLRLIQSDPKVYSGVRDLENTMNVKLH